MSNKYKQKENQHLYNAWSGMKKRCYVPQNKSYKYYGAKGVTVCDEWRNSFDSFAEWAYSNGYEDTLTIERIDNDKGYCPENCKWITKSEQQQNRSDKILIEHDGKTLNLKQWCILLGLDYIYIHNKYVRMRKNNISISFDDILVKDEDYQHKVEKNASGESGRRRKQVNQYDLNGNLIKTWGSISIAANAGFDQSSISRCCSGTRGMKKTGGYIWRYADD